MKLLVLLLFNCIALAGAFFPSAGRPNSIATLSEHESLEQLTEDGKEFFSKGDFQHAVESWEKALVLLDLENDTNQQLAMKARLAAAYQALGHYTKAFSTLQQAKRLAGAKGDSLSNAVVLSQLGDLYLVNGEVAKARQYLDQSAAIARQLDEPHILANILNNLGNVFMAQQQYPKALSAYNECIELAGRTHNDLLKVKGLTNKVRALLKQGMHQQAAATLTLALHFTRQLSPSHDKAFGLISLGQLALRLARLPPATNTGLILTAYHAFTDAAQTAKGQQDFRAAAYAYGYLGSLYEEKRRYPEAVELTRRALFFGHQTGSPEILYRWQWQLGRLLKVQGDADGAIEAYRHALEELRKIRKVLTRGYRDKTQTFSKNTEPIFYELADLLLRRAASLPDKQQKERDLLEARDTLERLKAAELTDYFQDECVADLESRTVHLDRVPPHTALIYPIALPDRLELLLTLPEGMKQVTVSVSASRLKNQGEELRQLVENRLSDFKLYANRLYGWLIRPIEHDLALHSIDTLVVVPDRILRTLPLAALYDGKQFLVQKYALAITPGLNLTDFRPTDQKRVWVLRSGLSEARPGFLPLLYVPSELQHIKTVYGGETLLNKDFVVDEIKAELKSQPYTIVHVATHGKFESDPSKSYLLTYNGKLTMNRLEELIGLRQFGDQPIELLTLSACQTATGDDRSALGLAGVALKAGARSALATLWSVDDASTSLLMSEFYKQLSTHGVSKAKALQAAQRKLLEESEYEHPYFWAAFLLIGNWL